jgi:hypothetical protein
VDGGEVLVVLGDGGDADGARKTSVSLGVWSTSSFVSRGEAERRLKWSLMLAVRLMFTVQLGTPRGRYDEYSRKVFPQ